MNNPKLRGLSLFANVGIAEAYLESIGVHIEVANELIANGSILPANVIFQAEFKQGDGVYAQIGNTYFCCKD